MAKRKQTKRTRKKPVVQNDVRTYWPKPKWLLGAALLIACLLGLLGIGHLLEHHMFQPTKTWPVEFEFLTLTKQFSRDVASAPKHYSLQIISVKNKKLAERLRANLTLLDYSPYIEPAKVKGQQWYRLFVGPFATLEEAKHHQVALKEHKIKSLLVKRQG